MDKKLQCNQASANQTITITIDLPADDAKLVNRLAEISGETKESLIKKFIGDGAEDLGDLFIARDVMEKIESGEERTYTQEEMRKEFELDD